MENFSFYNPTKIEFGKEKEKNIGAYIKPFNIKKVLLTFRSDRIKKDGLFDVVIKSLKENNIQFIEFGGIKSNPILSKVYEAIEIAKTNKVDAILSVGGGSVLDSSKAIATGSLYDGDVWDFFIGKATIQNALPIFDILTLAATGSEMNCGAVVTNEKTIKNMLFNQLIFIQKFQ
jgi:alcohol dehydrogenase YqhD (iron-dependent ADH family)